MFLRDYRLARGSLRRKDFAFPSIECFHRSKQPSFIGIQLRLWTTILATFRAMISAIFHRQSNDLVTIIRWPLREKCPITRQTDAIRNDIGCFRQWRYLFGVRNVIRKWSRIPMVRMNEERLIGCFGSGWRWGFRVMMMMPTEDFREIHRGDVS